MKKLQLNDDRGRIVTVAMGAIFLFFSLLFFLTGLFHNDHQEAVTPTPIGSTGVFKRSSATATMKKVFKDENSDVLGAVISLKEQSSSPLPYKAQDFFVSWTGDGDISGYFGRYSTDGDLYVAIPYPKKDVIYTVTITNLNYQGDTSSNLKDESLSSIKGSVSKQLSSDNELGNSSNTDTSKNSKSTSDSITFKLTLNDKTNNKNYKVTTISTDSKSLLNVNSSGKISFDFKDFWETIYKKPAVDEASTNLQNSIKRESEAQSSYNQWKERYDKNHNDLDAQTKLSDYANQIKKEEANQENYSTILKQKQSLKFDKDDFSDYSTKIYSVTK